MKPLGISQTINLSCMIEQLTSQMLVFPRVSSSVLFAAGKSLSGSHPQQSVQLCPRMDWMCTCYISLDINVTV